MVKNVKKVIPFMRKQGCGYGEIANKLNMTKDYVKQFCKFNRIGGFPIEYRLNVAEAQKRGVACMFCGMPLKQPKVGRKKSYCDELCRKKFYYSRKDGHYLSHE